MAGWSTKDFAGGWFANAKICGTGEKPCAVGKYFV